MVDSAARDGKAHAGRRALTASVWLLPVVLIVHAVTFWGRGIIDYESLSFVVNYLANRPSLAAIFDPRLNDWGNYQARELSYLFDLVDARVFAALLDRHILLFVPVSGVAGLVAVAAVYVKGTRKVLRLDGITSALVLSLFVSCIVIQTSTPILYRSSKITLSVAFLAFLFLLSFLLRDGGAHPASRRHLAGVFVLGVLMSLLDRQGFYYLVVAAAVVALLWLTATVRARGRAAGTSPTSHRSIVVAAVSAIAAAIFYNSAGAPALIYWVNGYWPDFSYQQLPIANLLSWRLAGQAWAMFRGQTSYFFGNAPFAAISLAGGGACLANAWRRRSVDPIVITLVASVSLVLLLALMILRHPPVYAIPDHSFWYYTLTIPVVFLFGVTLLLSGLGTTAGPWSRSALYLLLLLMIGNNVRHYQEQRRFMIGSHGWLSQTHARSLQLVSDFEAMPSASERAPASWVRFGETGLIVDLPIESQGFLAQTEAAYALLKHGRQIVGTGGPFWSALFGFLAGEHSPLNDPAQIGAVLEGLQTVGIRRVVIDRTKYRDAKLAAATASAALAATTPSISKTADDGRLVTIDLSNGILDPPPPRVSRPFARESFAIIEPGAGDHRTPTVDMPWTGGRQSDDAWLRVEFDSPHDLARVRIDLRSGYRAEQSLDEYPRTLLVASADGERLRILYQGSALPAVMKGLLREPSRAPIEIVLPPNRTQALVLRQSGLTRPWQWSTHELTFWERQSNRRRLAWLR